MDIGYVGKGKGKKANFQTVHVQNLPAERTLERQR